MTITFKNQQPLAAIIVHGRTQNTGGATRDVLEFQFPGDTNYDTLRGIYSDPESTLAIAQEWEETVANKEGIDEQKFCRNLHLNYIIPIELSLKAIGGSQRYVMSLGQLTPAERMQREQQKKIDSLTARIAALESR